MLLLQGEPGYVMFEPLPFRKTPKPPVVRDRKATTSCRNRWNIMPALANW